MSLEYPRSDPACVTNWDSVAGRVNQLLTIWADVRNVGAAPDFIPPTILGPRPPQSELEAASDVRTRRAAISLNVKTERAEVCLRFAGINGELVAGDSFPKLPVAPRPLRMRRQTAASSGYHQKGRLHRSFWLPGMIDVDWQKASCANERRSIRICGHRQHASTIALSQCELTPPTLHQRRPNETIVMKVTMAKTAVPGTPTPQRNLIWMEVQADPDGISGQRNLWATGVGVNLGTVVGVAILGERGQVVGQLDAKASTNRPADMGLSV